MTGGAGFIGSHLVDALLARGDQVRIVDDLSAGTREWVASRAELIVGDILDRTVLDQVLPGIDRVYHLAANPDVRVGATDTRVHLRQNVDATAGLLEAMRDHAVSELSFTSTSTVYGETAVIPTPEDHGPLLPISFYGASKLACEALISAHVATWDLTARWFRFANVVGPRSTHGVTYDFFNKLRADPRHLEILGDGAQCKSYCHVDDTVAGMLQAETAPADPVGIYNIGSEDWVDVKDIADLIVEEMGLTGVEYTFTGGVDGGRGWKGDVKVMRLAIEALKATGWEPRYDSKASIRATVRSLLDG